MKLRCAALVTLFSLGWGVSLHAQIDRITGKTFATRSEVLARHGMVCTSVPAATQVGLDVLKRGGSAVDAAIAANATLGLMEPVSNGIGGDLFAIVYSAKENKLYGLNGSGRSPLGLELRADESRAREAASRVPFRRRGMLPISVPGAVDALGGAAPEIRQAVVRRRSLRRDSLRGGRFSGHRVDRVLLGHFGPTLQRSARRFSRDLHARWQRPRAGERRHFQESRRSRTPCA